MNHRVAIIILNWNGIKDTLECLSSLKKVPYPDKEIIIVDNGSTDESVKVLKKQFPEYTLIETGENLGFAGGNNVGIQYALEKNFDSVFLLNNDTTVDPSFLQALVETAEKNPTCGVLGTKILSYNQPDKIDHLGGFWDPNKAEFDSFAHNQKDEETYSMQSVDYVCGCAIFIRKEVLEKIGLLEDRFFLLWEEVDFCYRARKAGFDVATAPKAKIWHKVSASFVGGKPHMHYFWWRSRLLWIERNCKQKEKLRLYIRIIMPELFKELRHYTLRRLQLVINPRRKREINLRKIQRHKAGLHGAKDYLLRKFSNGPSWLFTKLK